MAKHKYYNSEFSFAESYVLNKDKAIDSFIKYMLTRTQSIFTYSNLPTTIPQRMLEYYLQTKGSVFVTKVNEDLYALTGNAGGEPDAYNQPTKYIVANSALKLSKEYDIENDGVLVKNDSFECGIMPILYKYGALITENNITIQTVTTMLRIVCLISASDDRTHVSAEKFIKDIQDGKISAIGESAFFDGVKLQSTANTQSYLNQFIELEQYLKASCFNELGINANYNMKREQLGANESALNDDFLLPFVDNMKRERQEAIDKINKMYDTNITIDFDSAWRITDLENQKQTVISESIIDGIDNGVPTDVSISQSKSIHDNNDSDINIVPVDTNESEVDTNESEVDTNESEVDTNESEVDTNESEVYTNETEVDTDETEVDTDETEVDTDETEVDTDESEVDTDKRGDKEK